MDATKRLDALERIADGLSQELELLRQDLTTAERSKPESHEKADRPAGFVPPRYMLIPVFASLTGYTEKAVRRKIAEGYWIEGRHYRKSLDGRIHMDLEAYYRWIEGARH